MTSTLAGNAAWLWKHGENEPNIYLEFRAGISCSCSKAWIQLSAETSFRLYVGDRLLHSGPPREVPPYFYFDTIDLTEYIGRGGEIRIVAHHQGIDSQSYQADTPALLLAGFAECENGNRIDFGSPSSWQVRRLLRYRQDSRQLFFCLGFSEHLNFAAQEGEWESPTVVALHPWGRRPTDLARDLPALRETIRDSVSMATGRHGPLIDMGQEVAGYVELELVSSCPVSLEVAYAEILVDGVVGCRKAEMNYSDRLDWPGGKIRWRSYEKRAFRFIQLSHPVEVLSSSVVEQTWPYEPIWKSLPEPAEDAEQIQRIFEVSARSIELNSEDLLTDCPWRERAQYLDCQHYMGAIRILFGTLEPIRRFLNQFPRGADETGLLRMCYPSPPESGVIPDFSMSYAVLLARYLQLSSDLETVRRNLPLAERGVAYFEQFEDAEGLLANVPGWIFLDNTFELPKFPRGSGLNAIYHGAWCALAELFEACGEVEASARYLEKASGLRRSFRRAFLRGDRLLDADSTPEHETYCQWFYHHSAATGRWTGKTFQLSVDFRRETGSGPLYFSVHSRGRIWVDATPVLEIERDEMWLRSAVFERWEIPCPDDGQWHTLTAEVECNEIDWECFFSSKAEVEWSDIIIWDGDEYGLNSPDGPEGTKPIRSTLKRHRWPWMTQVSVGLAAWHGLLEPEEAAGFLRACLPDFYPFACQKKSTPFFAGPDDGGERILPCNVPASLFYFAHACRRYGLEKEIREFLLMIYQGMLDRGATTWWEQWNSHSSLCHAWSSFVVEFLVPRD